MIPLTDLRILHCPGASRSVRFLAARTACLNPGKRLYDWGQFQLNPVDAGSLLYFRSNSMRADSKIAKNQLSQNAICKVICRAGRERQFYQEANYKNGMNRSGKRCPSVLQRRHVPAKRVADPESSALSLFGRWMHHPARNQRPK
jgi:hypothetical protein